MRLCVATTWENELLTKLYTLNSSDAQIYEVFGSLGISVIGSGRDAGSLPDVERKKVRNHIELAHSLGMKFNYLMNAACIGNLEFTKEGQRKIRDYLRWIDNLGADTVTVSVPYLIELVHEECPNTEINISTINEVRSVQTAKYFREMGVDRITVSSMANRNLNLLKQMKEAVDCDMEVLANEGCTRGCPYRIYHYLVMAHASQEDGRPLEIPFMDYPYLKCSIHRMKNPEVIMMSGWIRPEDVKYYEEIGIDLIKIAGRSQTSEHIFHAASSYAKRLHKGNLAEIVDIPLRGTADYDDSTVPFKKPRIFIDNQALDGFLDKVYKIDCEAMCGTCNYCKEMTSRVLKIEGKDEYLKFLENTEMHIRRMLQTESNLENTF